MRESVQRGNQDCNLETVVYDTVVIDQQNLEIEELVDLAGGQRETIIRLGSENEHLRIKCCELSSQVISLQD